MDGRIVALSVLTSEPSNPKVYTPVASFQTNVMVPHSQRLQFNELGGHASNQFTHSSPPHSLFLYSLFIKGSFVVYEGFIYLFRSSFI